MGFADLYAGVGRLAEWLGGQAGGPGERVASRSAKTRAACRMPLAAARAGLFHVPVNPLLKAPQALHILADSGAKLLVTGASRADSLGEGRPEACVLQERSEEHTSELQSLMRTSYAVFCLKKKKITTTLHSCYIIR